MNIVHRHLLASYLKNLGYTVIGALILFTLVDLFDHIGSFVDNDTNAATIGKYYAFKAVWIVDTVLPIALLMATLFSVGGMARYLELTALFAAGWSLMRVCRPLIWLGVVVTIFSLVWREYVLPAANVERNKVWEVEIHGKPNRIRPTQHITLTDSEGHLYYARKFDPNTGLITGLKIFTYRGPVIAERVDAQRAEWDGEYWTLFDGTRRVFDGDEETTTYFDRVTAKDVTVNPKGFYRDRIRQEDMNIRQLKEHVELIELSGGDATTARVDIQFNLAFPLVNLIVVLMGILLASAPRKTTVASGFGWTLLISFGYYLFMNFGRSLGHTGSLPPIVAAWAGNVLYAAIFIVLYARARR
ncbi:MAG: lipopolysaccharide export system permease protein [Candidatus Krumholzibacteriia bacterium]|jgi:lipopolysaccharide export system permease protein